MTDTPWQRYYFILFFRRLAVLHNRVVHLRQKDPDNYKNHPEAKLFASVVRSMDDAQQDPTLSKFQLGKTLGPEYTAWRRIKQGLPPRYRLFFRFSSQDRHVIFVWLNDERTLRKEGAKTDVYSVFKSMLERNDIPSMLSDLLTQSEKISEPSH